MDMVLAGLRELASIYNILVMLVSVFLGIVVGAVPGLGPLLAIVLLIPFTMEIGAIAGIISLLSVYVGGVYGGSITAISLGIPGTPIATATLFDGHPMTEKGRGNEAQGLALTASVFGGTLSAVILMFGAPLLAAAALKFGPPEHFLLGILGLTTIASVSRGAFVKGLIAAAFGALLATVGTEFATGIGRFTFGSPDLARGIDLVAMLVGLYAISEVLMQTERKGIMIVKRRVAVLLPKIRQLGRSIGVYFRSAVIGTAIGAIPGVGEVIASLVSYSVTRDLSKDPSRFGTGVPEGIIATETANNACVGGALIPTLALAIPGSPLSAVLMGALILLGVSPGPKLFLQSQTILGVIFVGLLIVNIFMFFIGRYTARFIAGAAALPREYLIPLILLLAFLGTYALNGNLFDVWTMWAFGVIGFVLRKTGFPLAPVVIGMVLGPIIEPNFQRSMVISNNGILIFVTRPISLAILVATIVLVVVLPILNRRGARFETSR